MKGAISVIGLGRLGICLAVILADHGYKVIGIDISKQRIRELSKGHADNNEKDLQYLLTKNATSMTLATEYSNAVAKSDVLFIVVQTPSQKNGKFDNKYVLQVGKEIGLHLRNSNGFKTIVLVSTVLPGDTQKYLISTLEKLSNKKCGTDFGVCYNPELIAQGTIIRDWLNPDVVMIGESDAKAGAAVEKIYRIICGDSIKISRSKIINIELAKIALNVYITMKITYANILADLCTALPGANVDDVTGAIGYDTRINHKYLYGGMPYGGPCFPRDNKAYAVLLKRHNKHSELSNYTHIINDRLSENIFNRLNEYVGTVKSKHISILGLTYKTGTDIIEESASLKIIDLLLKNSAVVKVYDPSGIDNTKAIYGDRLIYCSSPKHCLKGSHLVLIATPWDEFKKLKPTDFTSLMEKPRIFDIWRIYDPVQYSVKIEYYAWGVNKPGLS